jgi:hypothetical protein
MAVPEVDGFAKYLATLKPEDIPRALRQAKMLAAANIDDSKLEPPIRTLGQYLIDPIEVPPTLVDPFLVVRGGMTCTIGRAGKGKTVMNLNRILRWAAGLPMFDTLTDSEGTPVYAATKPLKTLVIENEGAGGLFHRQVGIMLHSEDYLSHEARELAKENVLIWRDGGYAGLKLDNQNHLTDVRRGVEKWEPDVVFVEPFRGLWDGEENSATDMNKVVGALMDVAADYKVGVMIAHHERKSGVGEDGELMSAGRGSTVLEGVVTVMENFQAVVGGDFRELTVSKSRHGKAPAPVRMSWDAEAWWYKHIPQDNIETAIIEALGENSDEPMTVADLAEATGEKKTKLQPILASMAKGESAKLKKLPSVSSGNGSTGARYLLPSAVDGSDYGGLGI